MQKQIHCKTNTPALLCCTLCLYKKKQRNKLSYDQIRALKLCHSSWPTNLVTKQNFKSKIHEHKKMISLVIKYNSGVKTHNVRIFSNNNVNRIFKIIVFLLWSLQNKRCIVFYIWIWNQMNDFSYISFSQMRCFFFSNARNKMDLPSSKLIIWKETNFVMHMFIIS